MKTKKTFIYFIALVFCLSGEVVLASESCSSGLVWNETISECLNSEDNARVNEKQLMCDSKAEGTGKTECNEMVQSFAKDPKDYADVDDMGLSKKEKGIKAIGTVKSVASAGIAAYKLFEAYQAAKSVKDVFSNMCMSGMMSIATGVMSFMNDKNMDKQVKQTLKASKKNLDALIERNKASKGTSYEMQIELMQAYKQILDAGAQAAQIRMDGYKQEVMMYSIALGIAAIEIIAYTYTGNDKGVTCASWVAGSATVSVALGSKMKSAASKAKKKYESEAEKLGKVLKKYMDFFNKKHIDQQSLSTQMALSGSAGAPINAKSGSEAQEFPNKDLTDAEKNMCSAAPSTDCCNDSGKKCPTFKVSMGNPTVSSAIGKSGLGGALERADSRLQGSLNLGDSGVSLAINKDLRRAKAFKKRVLEQLKDKGRLTASQAELFDQDKQMKGFLKSKFGNENARLGSSFGESMALPDVDRISKLIDEGDVPKELSKEKKNLSSSFNNLAALAKMRNSLNSLGLDEEDDYDADSIGGGDLAVNTGLEEGEEYIYDKDQIVKKPEVSIFQVISNRYNVLRINKRFGQRVSN